MIFLHWMRSKNILITLILATSILSHCFAATTHHTEANKKSRVVTTKHVKKITSTKKNQSSSKTALKSRNKHQRKQVAKKKNSKKGQIIKPLSIAKSSPEVSILDTKGFVASIEHRLVGFVRKTVTNLRYSAYKLGGSHFDPSRGVYIVDCSSYVDHILKTIHPRAYSSLVNSSRSAKPTSDDYYHFFTKLINRPQYYWNAVEDVEALRPGDILVFRKKNKYGTELSGHVMIVMEKPKREKNTFWLRIADSAPFRHSLDTRLPHVSGIGIGTFLLKVNPKTFQPAAYAWTTKSPWKHNVDFAMGRPVDFLA